MATFLELKNRVSGIVIDLPTFVQEQVGNLVNKAIRDLQDDHEFIVQARDQSATATTVGTRTLSSIPDNFKRIRGRPYEVIYEDDVAVGFREMEYSTESSDKVRLFDLDDEGAPQMLFESTSSDDDATRVWEVYPLPDGLNPGHSDGEYRVIVPYWAYTTALSADGDNNWFTNNAEWYIVFAAASEGFFLDWDYSGGAVWAQKAQAEKIRVVKADKMLRVADADTFVPHKDVYAPKTQFRGGSDWRYYGFTKM